MASASKAPSPARLSSISTSLLTSILELSQQNSLELTVHPGSQSKIIKNLLSLRDGLIENGINENDPILVGLRNQYERIVGLVRGMGGMESYIQGQHLEIPSSSSSEAPPSPTATVDQQPLIDVGEAHPAGSSNPSSLDRSTHRTPPKVHFDSPQASRDHTSIHIPSRSRSRNAILEDEQLMRSENEQVQRIQQVLLDDQDKTLDELSNAISRQRDLSLHISSELEVQENLLDELDQDLDFTSTRLTRANKRMDSLFRKIAKDGACWTIFGLVAILLFLIVLLK
ncbi:hypothetical protein PCANC_21708 [Puccinia coronata f. sp. avenae]|uniref:t-SNARE coiled-coil homology domain-containing protein n=1 Tax=Puccinia coronata f. sp. avenae TaxID=200324 RepID=A0A2N5UTL9_9BASI|nr:hypothetical protein PCANC_21708 [Puccinia coronata f. sp. avenae]PLW40987.1 hypothetical protein PCASD_06628 [Puccinia coronata f. sp. avenae]